MEKESQIDVLAGIVNKHFESLTKEMREGFADVKSEIREVNLDISGLRTVVVNLDQEFHDM